MSGEKKVAEKALERRRRITPVKKRSSSCYERKCEKIKKWHERLELYREENKPSDNPNTKLKAVRKPLKPLDWYLEKVRKFGK